MSSADLVVLRYIKETTLGVTPDDSVRAQGTLTGSANFGNTETVTVGGKTYTFQTTLTNVDGNVHIGASLTASLLNLFNAINATGGVPGTDYAAAMTENENVESVSSNATTLVVRAKLGGTAGNSIASTETCANAAWGGATLAGGTNSTVTALNQVRYTGESLNFNIQNTKTSEIRPDRTETDLIQTQASAAGNINLELSYGTFDDFLEAVFCGAWTTNVLENGVDLQSFSLQKHFQDMDVPQFHLFHGATPESLDLKMEVGKIVEGSFGFMALGCEVSESQIGGATFPPVSSTTPMNAVSNVRDFTIDGVPYSGCISKLGVNLKNNVRAIQCIGSLEARDMKLGTLEVTGDVEFYFNDGSNYEKFVEGTEFSMQFELRDDAGNSYLFFIPRAKFESGEVVAGGRNTDVMFTAKWRALYDATEECVIRLTRDPA